MINQTNRKTYSKQECLPVKLVTKLQECIFNNNRYQYTTKNNFLQCVSIIFYHQVNQGIGLKNYVSLGRNYWRTIYGGNYHEKVIEPLLNEHKIIESKDFGYRTFPNDLNNNQKGKQEGLVGIRYRINPDLLDDQYECISYIEKRVVLTAFEKILFDDKEFSITGIQDLDFHVSIDHKKAREWVDKNAESICNEFMKQDYINCIPDSLKVEYKELVEISGNWTYNDKYGSIKAAKKVAEIRAKELFYFKDAFYIADVQEFMKQRLQAIKYHYKYQISQIGIMPIEEKRSPVTLRFYSHLTNFPSKILQFININNKTVVQLDLRTSQFLIFANILNVYLSKGEQFLLSKFKQKNNQTYLKKLVGILKKYQNQLPEAPVDISDINSGKYSLSDVTKFIRDVFFNDFYNVVQQELQLPERLLAKHVLFKLLFKKTNRPDELLSHLSKRYPVVVDIIAEFKKNDLHKTLKSKKMNHADYGSNFSVFLQCVEGELFVDNILNKLRNDKIPCFTRHDSIVVASGYEQRSEEIAKQVFSEFGFKYNHKVEDKFWEVLDDDEFEMSNYMQYLSDEDLLEQDYFVDETIEESNEDEIETNELYDMDEQQLETLEKLKEIGIQDNYYDFVNIEFLEDLTLLPFLNEQQRNVIYDDINNLNYGMSFFQDETNKLLRQILSGDEGI